MDTFLVILILVVCVAGLVFVVVEWKDRSALINRLTNSSPPPPPPPPPEAKAEPLTGAAKKMPEPPVGGGLVLNGFTDGAVARIHVPGELFDRQPWGVCFGRDPALVDLVLKDDRGLLSRRHFRISRLRSGGQYEIEDLGSTAGVKVKGDALKPFDRRPLPVPCRIEIGAATSLQVTVA
jgi:hypothetical protein